jgi:hypothetical protein
MRFSEETSMWIGVILTVFGAIAVFVALVVLYFVLDAKRNRRR